MLKKLFYVFTITTIIITIIIYSIPAKTQSSQTDLPKRFVEELADKMITNITSKSNDKVAVFRKMFIENLDLNSISRFVLGTHWRTIDEQKKQEFVHSFTEASVLTWSGRFDEYKGENIVFENSTPAPSPNQFFVKSTINIMDNNDVEVIWRLQKKDHQFKIIDIIIEGVSMAMTYRNEYNSIIQNSSKGIDGLIASLNSKIEEYNK